MAELYLKNDETWGLLPGGSLSVDPWMPCPPGTIDSQAVCIAAPCPKVCISGEPYTLSGQPPGTVSEVLREREAGPPPEPAPPSQPSSILSKLAWLWIAIPGTFLLLMPRQNKPGTPRR
jgi:hypothetical protein